MLKPPSAYYTSSNSKVLKFEVFFFFLLMHTLAEKAMAPYSSTLSWKIPWTEEPGRL